MQVAFLGCVRCTINLKKVLHLINIYIITSLSKDEEKINLIFLQVEWTPNLNRRNAHIQTYIRISEFRVALKCYNIDNTFFAHAIGAKY